MANKIEEDFAFQVVTTVKDVCGQDINFINQSGIIFASTVPERIGTFHEIGYKAALAGNTIEVTADDSFYGTQRGVNLPVYYHHEFLAVIGITGDPDIVRKYAHLAERITHLLIREREFNMDSRNQSEKKHFVIDSLIKKADFNMGYLNSCLTELNISIKEKKRVIFIKVQREKDTTNLSIIEQKIIQTFRLLSITLFTFYYPNIYVAVIEEQIFKEKSHILEQFAHVNKELQICAGKISSIYQLADSYASALIAEKAIFNADNNFIIFDNLTLEIFISNLKEEEKNEFLSKTILSLLPEEQELIRVYFDENMSLINTGDRLFLHKNTLQYKLNHIYKKCGLNPRRFKDAVLLYLALQLLPAADR
ncbi:CdaR family transcriptional regulator [Mediterraneibacter agrestimuris]|uniref:CdaR family transcriptional regulator n=1 Tax=Mediterraneibacter agrestimuris TaxID=2941333 RepID=UPI00203ABA41|nr:sugar diacid recognition domain-containing protein [Mediterraneibacter agrestimuris]